MFKLFKKQQPMETKYNQVIEQIHHEFNTAGDQLLQEAIGILADSKLKDKHKGKLLARLGFVNTPQAKETLDAERAEKQAEETANLVHYYSQKYPFNKFINEEAVKKICSKYNLVCGDVSLYKGFVPADKLEIISNFKISYSDTKMTVWSIGICGDYKGIEKKDGGEDAIRYTSLYKKEMRVEGLKICASLKDMDVTGMRLSGYNLIKHIPDPVVLQPCKGGYLIVCAWGDEASDEIVVNPIQN